MLRWMLANLHNALDDTGMDLWIRGMMGARVREQHLQVIQRSLPQSLQPLLDPTQRAAHSVSQILVGPREACSRARLRRVARSAIHSTSIVSFTSFPLTMMLVKPLT